MALTISQNSGLKARLREAISHIAGLGATPARTGVSAGVGVFIGLLPIAPLQTLAAICAAFAFRLNRVAVFAGTLIWQPFTAPFIIGAELAAGRLLLGAPPAGASWRETWLKPAAAGAILLATVGGIISGAAVAFAKSRFDRRKSQPNVSTSEGGA